MPTTWITIKEAVERTGLQEETILRWIHQGLLEKDKEYIIQNGFPGYGGMRYLINISVFSDYQEGETYINAIKASKIIDVGYSTFVESVAQHIMSIPVCKKKPEGKRVYALSSVKKYRRERDVIKKQIFSSGVVYLNTDDAATFLGVTPERVQQLRKENKLAGVYFPAYRPNWWHAFPLLVECKKNMKKK